MSITLTIEQLDQIRLQERMKLLDELHEAQLAMKKVYYMKYCIDPIKRQQLREKARERYYKRIGKPIPEDKVPTPGRGRPRQYIYDDLDEIELLNVKDEATQGGPE